MVLTVRGRVPQGPTLRIRRASGTRWDSGAPQVVLPVLRSRTVTVAGSLAAKACVGAVTLRTMCRALQFSNATWAVRVMLGAAAGAVAAVAVAAVAVAGTAYAAAAVAVAAVAVAAVAVAGTAYAAAASTTTNTAAAALIRRETLGPGDGFAQLKGPGGA